MSKLKCHRITPWGRKSPSLLSWFSTVVHSSASSSSSLSSLFESTVKVTFSLRAEWDQIVSNPIFDVSRAFMQTRAGPGHSWPSRRRQGTKTGGCTFGITWPEVTAKKFPIFKLNKRNCILTPSLLRRKTERKKSITFLQVDFFPWQEMRNRFFWNHF